jgi:hypothetical protein
VVPSLEWHLIQSQYELKQVKTPNFGTWETFSQGLPFFCKQEIISNLMTQPIEADEVEMP